MINPTVETFLTTRYNECVCDIFDAFGWMKGEIRNRSLDHSKVDCLSHYSPKTAHEALAAVLHKMEEVWRANDEADGVEFVCAGRFRFVSSRSSVTRAEVVS